MSVIYFLVSFLVNSATFVLWVRVAIRYFKISVLHPISQLIFRFTDPWLAPFDALCAQMRVDQRRIDWSCLSLIFSLQFIKFSVIKLIMTHLVTWSIVLLLSFANLVVEPCNVLFYAIIIRVFAHWINPTQQHPVIHLCVLITEPLLGAIRPYMPYLDEIDFSPLVAIVLLKIIVIFISASMPVQIL